MQTFKSFTASALTALLTVCSVALSAPAHADIKWNGVDLNGIRWNGLQLNGFRFNGIQFNGPVLQGVGLNGYADADPQPSTFFAVTLPNGEVLPLR